jgi:ABC-type Fe3+-hydroxamate transport system substrate-binding protein
VTELLFDLGVGDRVVGVTRYCVEPAVEVAALPRIGGTKGVDLDAIEALRPDLILAVKEENIARDVLRLSERGLPVYVSDVCSVDDGVALIGEIADLVDAAPIDFDRVRGIALTGIAEARRIAGTDPPLRVYCPVWRDPWITISPDTYMFDLLRICGAEGIFVGRREAGRYPKVGLDEVRAQAPDLILLPDEPYAFTATDVAELAGLAPAVIVDGKRLGWYGRRLGEAPKVAEVVRAVRARIGRGGDGNSGVHGMSGAEEG